MLIPACPNPSALLHLRDLRLQSMWHRLASLALFLLLALTAMDLTHPSNLKAAQVANGLWIGGHVGDEPLIVKGVIDVYGVAVHETFHKWQLDLLLNGSDPTFLAIGEEQHPVQALLAKVDTRAYPDGEHLLRLRVVYVQMNYEEYFLPVTFANTQTTLETVTPAPTASPVPAPLIRPAVAEPVAKGRANGIRVEEEPIQGSATIYGSATDPNFLKWQIDLLPNGDQNLATFIAIGEEPQPDDGALAELDTTLYPNGTHVLRLRVVRTDTNYDEYFHQIDIQNSASASAPVPAPGGVRSGSAAEAVLYLTFDDGPNRLYTPQILDLLAQYDAKATFFVLGSAAETQAPLIRSMYEAGHGIGNHSWSHRNLAGLSEEAFNEEVGGTASVLGAYSASCLRPPYGTADALTYRHAATFGYSVVLWSIDPADWRQPGAQAIANHVINRAFPGAIILLHDGGGNRSQTVSALETILKQLSAAGYSFRAYCR